MSLHLICICVPVLCLWETACSLTVRFINLNGSKMSKSFRFLHISWCWSSSNVNSEGNVIRGIVGVVEKTKKASLKYKTCKAIQVSEAGEQGHVHDDVICMLVLLCAFVSFCECNKGWNIDDYSFHRKEGILLPITPAVHLNFLHQKNRKKCFH